MITYEQLQEYKRKYTFLAEEYIEQHNIQKAIIYEAKIELINELLKKRRI